MNFNQWKQTLFSLDRYENGGDAKTFTALIAQKPADASERQYIEALLQTFSNQDDYGIQESVLTVLDGVAQAVFFETLGNMFQEFLSNTEEQEWGLLLLGRTVNSCNEAAIKEMVSAAQKCTDKTMLEFLKSEEFCSEYPEILPFLASA